MSRFSTVAIVAKTVVEVRVTIGYRLIQEPRATRDLSERGCGSWYIIQGYRKKIK